MSSSTTKTASRARRREDGALTAAALTNGPAELVDFLLPLWAGVALGMSPTAIGVLVALEMAVSVVVRPLAGVLADARERRYVAAAGALLYGVACAGYAVAEVTPVAYGAAALSGVGGALLWVSVRAIVGERLAEDSAVYPKLMAARENGSWVAFVTGLMLLQFVDFTGIFLGCATACGVAALVLLVSPRRQRGSGSHAGADAGALGLGGVGRRLRPMLVAVAFTMTAEAAIGMLLLLHLQREFDLEVVQIAYVFLPGAIAMGVLPEPLHAAVVRYGRTTVLALASVASAAFAVSLAWAPNPFVIAGLWILSGGAWAAVMPVQEAVVAEASGAQVGRGMGFYEAAALVGGAVGTLAAGILYDHGSWTTACIAAAVVILAGAVIMPRAVRLLGVENFPPPPPRSDPMDDGADDSAEVHPVEEADQEPPVKVSTRDEEPDAPEAAPTRPRTVGDLLLELGAHALLFTVAQAALVIVDASWLMDLAGDNALGTIASGTTELEGIGSIAYDVGRIWVIVLLIDIVMKLVQIARLRR